MFARYWWEKCYLYKFRKEIFESAVKEINEMSPDVVLVTGDLTENVFI